MGTRYEDQPVEQWAGPESLDPTPVWKQYILIALLLALALVVVLATSVTSLAPQFVTPPAIVFGDRLVLNATDLPAVGAPPKLSFVFRRRNVHAPRIHPPTPSEAQELAGLRLGELAARLGSPVPEDLRRAKGFVGGLLERSAVRSRPLFAPPLR